MEHTDIAIKSINIHIHNYLVTVLIITALNGRESPDFLVYVHEQIT
jgi:hypothetical protein